MIFFSLFFSSNPFPLVVSACKRHGAWAFTYWTDSEDIAVRCDVFEKRFHLKLSEMFLYFGIFFFSTFEELIVRSLKQKESKLFFLYR